MALLLVFFGLAICYSLVSRLIDFYRLRQFKGPLSAAFSRLFLIRAAWSGRQRFILHETAKQHGNLTRIAPNLLLITDTNIWRQINSARSQYHKSDQYNSFKFDARGHHVISETDPAKWKRLRQVSAHGFSGKEIGDVEPSIDAMLTRLFELLRQKTSTPEKPKYVDIAELFHYYSSDFITKIDFGKELGFMETDTDIFHYAEDTKTFFPFIGILAVWPNLFHFLDNKWIRPLWEPQMMREDRGVGALRKWARQEVVSRFESGKSDQRDMLGSFIRHGMNQFDAECTALLQVMAGSDTVSSALTSAIFMIASNPAVNKKAYEEISQWKKENGDAVISQAKSKTLPYIQACIKESMRRAAVVSGIQERTVPAGGDVLAGKFIPGGTRVAFELYGALHDEKIFGLSPEKFQPERWLGKSQEEIDRMSSTLGMVFGVGRIDCMGKAIAYMEMDKAVPELIYHFNFILKNNSDHNLQHHHVLAWHELMACVVERSSITA